MDLMRNKEILMTLIKKSIHNVQQKKDNFSGVRWPQIPSPSGLLHARPCTYFHTFPGTHIKALMVGAQ